MHIYLELSKDNWTRYIFKARLQPHKSGEPGVYVYQHPEPAAWGNSINSIQRRLISDVLQFDSSSTEKHIECSGVAKVSIHHEDQIEGISVTFPLSLVIDYIPVGSSSSLPYTNNPKFLYPLDITVPFGVIDGMEAWLSIGFFPPKNPKTDFASYEIKSLSIRLRHILDYIPEASNIEARPKGSGSRKKSERRKKSGSRNSSGSRKRAGSRKKSGSRKRAGSRKKSGSKPKLQTRSKSKEKISKKDSGGSKKRDSTQKKDKERGRSPGKEKKKQSETSQPSINIINKGKTSGTSPGGYLDRLPGRYSGRYSDRYSDGYSGGYSGGRDRQYPGVYDMQPQPVYPYTQPQPIPPVLTPIPALNPSTVPVIVPINTLPSNPPQSTKTSDPGAAPSNSINIYTTTNTTTQKESAPIPSDTTPNKSTPSINTNVPSNDQGQRTQETAGQTTGQTQNTQQPPEIKSNGAPFNDQESLIAQKMPRTHRTTDVLAR